MTNDHAWKDPLLVGLGAAFGASARYLVFLGAPAAGADIHVLTTVINGLACFAMGRWAPGKFWGTGVLGGFSTLSAVSVAAAQSTPAAAAGALALSLAVCLASWFAGDAVHTRGATGKGRA